MDVHFVTIPPPYLPLKSAQDCTIQCSIPLTVQMDSFIWLNFHKRVQGKKLKYKTSGCRDVSVVERALLPGVQFPACTVGGWHTAACDSSPRGDLHLFWSLQALTYTDMYTLLLLKNHNKV